MSHHLATVRLRVLIPVAFIACLLVTSVAGFAFARTDTEGRADISALSPSVACAAPSPTATSTPTDLPTATPTDLPTDLPTATATPAATVRTAAWHRAVPECKNYFVGIKAADNDTKAAILASPNTHPAVKATSGGIGKSDTAYSLAAKVTGIVVREGNRDVEKTPDSLFGSCTGDRVTTATEKDSDPVSSLGSPVTVKATLQQGEVLVTVDSLTQAQARLGVRAHFFCTTK